MRRSASSSQDAGCAVVSMFGSGSSERRLRDDTVELLGERLEAAHVPLELGERDAVGAHVVEDRIRHADHVVVTVCPAKRTELFGVRMRAMGILDPDPRAGDASALQSGL